MPATSSEVDTLRLATAGSVDDGKSTLIGRLLYDSKSILADQLEHIAEVSHARNGNGHLDLALLTDGLRAEREQGITIDVAHRYFATPRRRFILADTPGPRAVHAQHGHRRLDGGGGDRAGRRAPRRGRADAPARSGGGLLRVGHVVLAVNKMDLVGWSEEVFDRIVADFDCFASKIGLGAVTPLPLSALHGDNVVEPSERLAWYAGPPLLEHLETLELPAGEPGELRFPVQWVLRGEERAYAGRVGRRRAAPGRGGRRAAQRRARARHRGRDARRTAGGGARGPVGVRAPRSGARPRRAATSWPPPNRRPGRPARSRRTSAGSPSGRLRPGATAGSEAWDRNRARGRRRGRQPP